MRVQSLRTKLVIANILPILLLMPLLSLYLLNTLEEFYTEKLLQRLTQQGLLLLEQVRREPALVENAGAAQRFLAAVARSTDARVLLLSAEGVILGSTRPTDADRIGTQYMAADIQRALHGLPAQGTGQGLVTEVAYVVKPVAHDGAIQGVLRLSYEMDDLRLQLNQLHWLVLSGTGVTALWGLALGLGLARTLTGSIDRLVGCIRAIAAGNYRTRVDTPRDDEIGLLASSVNRMATQLADAEALRQQQLAAIVHELARPLTSMSVAVEVLLDEEESDPALRRDFLAGVGEEIARLQRLVGALQQVRRQSLEPLPIHCTAVSLPRMISAGLTHCKPLAARLGVTLSAQLPADLPSVRADEDRLLQVLINLLDNALKFTPRGGRITIEAATAPEADMVWVAVTDTGCGIAPDELPHLFQQFYRGAESRAPEKRGMGLGLALCHQIITAHGGKIWVESRPGQGTRMIFTLPPLDKL